MEREKTNHISLAQHLVLLNCENILIFHLAGRIQKAHIFISCFRHRSYSLGVMFMARLGSSDVPRVYCMEVCMCIRSLTKVRSVHNVHSQNKQTENHICVTKQAEGKRKLHTHCKLLSVIPWRNYETFNTQTCQKLGVYPEYIDYMYCMRTVNLVVAKNVKTKLVSSSSIFLILC